MLSPGNPVGGPVTLTSNTSDTGGSGIATVAYELAPNGGSFNSQSASWDTTLVSDGLYDLRVVATDVAGNSTTSTVVTTRVDNTAPALTFSSPAAGTIVSGTVNLVGSATDASPASPSVTFAYKLASDPPSAYTATGASWNTATLPAGDGIYDLRARATDDASNTASVENTSVRVDNAPPTVSITAPAAAINGSLPSPTTFAANASDPAGSGVDPGAVLRVLRPEQRLRNRRLEPARHRSGARPVQRLLVDPGSGRQPRSRSSRDRQRRAIRRRRSGTSTSTGPRRARRS